MAYEENGFGTADGFDDDEFDDDSNLGFDDDEFELSDDDQEDEQQTSLAASDTEGFDDDDFYDEGADDFGSEIDLTTEGLSEPEPKKLAADFDFVAKDGSVSVMDNSQTRNSFELIDELPLEKLVIAGKRIRQRSAVTSLSQSIKQTGLLMPIVVAPTMTQGTYVLVHGFRRVIAMMSAGSTTVPAIVNKRIKSSEISIVEALYNQYTPYTMRECADFIKYLETERGIMSPSMFEMLLQWNSGDYSKYKDIMDDNDHDIVEKLFGGEFTIAQAFQALEKRRKKESREEKQNKTTAKAYDSEQVEQAEGLLDTGSEVEQDGEGLTEEQISDLMIDPTKLGDDLSDKSLDEMVEAGAKMEGYEPHKQDWKNRERIDPAIRKAVMARDNNTCQCCKKGGPDYVDILDLHHIVEVFLGGEDSVANSITLCLNCHKQVHLYAHGKLTIPKTLTAEELDNEAQKALLDENTKREAAGAAAITEQSLIDDFKLRYRMRYLEEQDRYKRIVKLGNIIREGLRQKGMSKEQAAKDYPIDSIGRLKPGVKNIRG